MKPLSQHIQETLNNASLRDVLVEKLVDEELNDLTRIAPVEKVKKTNTTTLVDAMIDGK